MSRKDLVQELTAQRDEWLHWLDALDATELTRPHTAEGWSIRDYVGHLSFWEQQTLNHIRDTVKTGRPIPMPPESLDNDLNGRAAELRKSWKWDRVRTEFVNTRNALIDRVSKLPEPYLAYYVPSPWVNDERFQTLEHMVREDVLGHANEHWQELMAWQRANQNATPSQD